MDLYFDEDVQDLILLAKEEMFNLRHPYVGTEHLFLAILKKEELEVTKILNSYNITYKRFYEELISSIGIGSKSNDWFLFTPLLKKIINNAEYYSNEKITPYSLLVSIFQEGDGVANRILICLKVDVDSLYEEFLTYSDQLYLHRHLLLDDIAINMNEQSINEDSVIGRDEEINNIIQVLLRKNKNNPLLLGEAGVGKTAVIEELSRRIVNGNVPYKIKDYIIYNLPMSVLISGTKYRGEFEERFNEIIKEAIDNPNIVLFIDEIHTIIGAGGAEGAIDASNIIKPYLARGNIKIIGATTTYEYHKLIEKDKALNRRFHKILIEEPKDKQVKKILQNLKKTYEEFHNVIISNDLISEIVKTSNNLLFYNRQPDKAIDLLDEVCSFASFNNTKELELEKLNNKINKLNILKNKEIESNNITKALNIRKRQLKLTSEVNNAIFTNKKEPKYIESDDLYKVLYRKTKIPIIKTNYLDLIKNSNDQIKEFLIELDKFDFINSKKPLTFILKGSNNKEKEKLIKKVINTIFKQDIIKIDMNEYKEENSLSKLIGSKYFDDIEILNNIKEYPFRVLLIENIDKCNNTIFNYISKSMERGYFTDYKDNKYYISKSIIFFSINNEYLIGFNSNIKDNKYLEVNKVIDFDNNLVKS